MVPLQNISIRGTIAVGTMVRIPIARNSPIDSDFQGEFVVGSIEGRIGCSLKLLHDFLQDGPIRFQFKALAGIPRRVLPHTPVAVAYLPHDKESHQSHDRHRRNANKDRDGNVQTALLFGFGNLSRRRIKVKARPISRNVALDKLAVLQQ